MNSASNSKTWAGAVLSGALCLGLCGASAFCKTVPVEDSGDGRSLSREARLKLIKELYRPSACFLTDLRMDFVPSTGSSQGAKGSVRADNARNRMHMAFKDPYFGITITELTITAENVYISGIRQKSRTIPTDQFQVRGMGNNSIALPFLLFQDILYGRIPEAVYAAPAKIDPESGKMTIVVKGRADEAKYEFTGDRLTRLLYSIQGSTGQVDVNLTGRFQGSPFPEKMEIRSGDPTGPVDTLKVEFSGVNPQATCSDQHFPAQT